MAEKLTNNCSRIIHVALLVILVPGVILAQSLSSKLSQKADFVPGSSSPKEQLIELAQHYKIPMGIEWIYTTDRAPSPLLSGQPTVMAMIDMIIQEAPGYSVLVRNGIVNIRNNSFSSHPHNFLNLRMSEYKVSNVNVFGAEWQLRVDIHRSLHPERYTGGSNGGYGYGIPREDGFNIKNISFSGMNLTVREILNAIVKENGNALWVVELVPSKMMRDEPFFAQRSYGSDMQTDFTWRIIPFSYNK